LIMLRERLWSMLLSLSIVILRWADVFYLHCWHRHAQYDGGVYWEDTPLNADVGVGDE
jgi:hypothetical protein